jgi:hypothetical protein
MLMDDLKVYEESWGQLERTVEEVEEVSEAMGMAFGLKKCVVVHRRVGRFSVEGELPLTQGREIPELEEGQSYGSGTKNGPGCSEQPGKSSSRIHETCKKSVGHEVECP